MGVVSSRYPTLQRALFFGTVYVFRLVLGLYMLPKSSWM